MSIILFAPENEVKEWFEDAETAKKDQAGED
jgi:hypothetical protein